MCVVYVCTVKIGNEKTSNNKMTFLGEFTCTVDDKGRVRMPATLKSKFPAADEGKFMMVKGLDDCLVIYPLAVWQQEEAKLRKLNRMNPDHRAFINAFTIGVSEMQLDGNDRLQISKQLMRYLGNAKEVIVKGELDQIQIWEVSKYEQFTAGNSSNMHEVSERVAKYLDDLEAKGK